MRAFALGITAFVVLFGGLVWLLGAVAHWIFAVLQATHQAAG